MAETLTDVDTFNATIQMPTSGEVVSAADLRDRAVQRLANRTYNLKLRLDDADAWQTSSTGITSALSGISAVNTILMNVYKSPDSTAWVVGITATVTNSVTGDKEFEITPPNDIGNGEDLDELFGSGVTIATGNSPRYQGAYLRGVAGTQRIRVEWNDSMTSGITRVAVTCVYVP